MPTPPHPGAPKGNTNALKHGFYSRAFRTAEQTGLDDFDPTSLQNEIELMRVFMLRTAELGEQAATLAESMTLLNVLSRAALSLGALIRTHQALTLRKQSADLTDLTAQLNAANRRATALLKLLPPQQPAQNIPVADDAGARKASCIATPPAAGCETDQNLHHEDVKDAKKAETGKENTALDTQSALSSSRSSRLRGASSFDPPTPTYTLGPAPCLPSPQCFTCPERPLCPDCQTYLRTHTPPYSLRRGDRPVAPGPGIRSRFAHNRSPLARRSKLPVRVRPGRAASRPSTRKKLSQTRVLPPPTLPYPLSLFYTLQPPNCSELFPSNNSPFNPPEAP